MKIDGFMIKEGEFFAVEIPMLGLFTQGESLKDALEMAKDAVETVVDKKGFEATVELVANGRFTVSTNDDRVLLATCLKQLRATYGLSVREAAKKLGSDSPTAYSVYESGASMPSFEKFGQIVCALSGQEPVLSFPEKKRA